MASSIPWAPTTLVAAGGNKTHTAGTAATASGAIATGVGAGGANYVINLVSTQAFNIAFSPDGTDTIANPADNSAFPANTVIRFLLNSKNSHFKFTPVANNVLTWWKDRA